MQPFRIVRSEAELESVATDSLVSGAYCPKSIHEKAGPNAWVEPGCEDEVSTAALWEMLTGTYETNILDEDREVWVLIDAAAPQPVRPPRGQDSPDYLTRARPGDHAVEWVLHATLTEARAEIESLVAGRPAADNMVIYAREDKNRIEFYPIGTSSPGADVARLPWLGQRPSQ